MICRFCGREDQPECRVQIGIGKWFRHFPMCTVLPLPMPEKERPAIRDEP